MGEESQRKTRRNALSRAAGLCVALLVCAAVSGCGYSYARSRLSDYYSTLAVPAFKNRSFEPDIQILVTNLLIRELQADGRFRIVDATASADLVLTGAITDFEAQASIQALMDGVLAWRGDGHLKDDVSILVVEMT